MEDIGLSKLKECFIKYEKTFEDLSKNDEKAPLVGSKLNAYCFDEIVGDLFPENRKLCSADALYCVENHFLLVEFKRGFARELRESEFEEADLHCERCKEYLGHFKRALRKNIEVNYEVEKQNLQLKIVESYYILQRIVLNKYGIRRDHLSISFTIVIDAKRNPISAYEEMSSELSGSNSISNISKSVARYGSKLSNSEVFMYDSIRTIAAEYFESFISGVIN